jgi:hypothetical protein
MRIRTATLTWVAALVAVGALLTACGGTSTVETEPTNDDDRPTATSKPTPKPSDKGPEMPPAKPPEDSEWTPLIRIDKAERDASGNTLTIGYTLPTPCTPDLREAEVDQRDDAVTVKLHRRKPGSAEDQLVCTQVIQEKSVEIHLDEPLEDRPLVDGSSGKTIKVTG